ncbi:hypothetical protein LVY65_04495 [Sphingomonas sp. G124]|uniref:Polysaccharide biosynthesis protein n=1 Tax=Sphingomonas cremea TaxID=2904799 RepID=A0A9X1QJM3_9SPHN|nr:hypothetical protein [Sphingomonas cremea]MCF2514325.1 hypothetical protein [Sphingomonas cremea]
MTRTVGSAVTRGGLLSLTRLLTGIVRVKVVALALGAAGVGEYAILLQLYLTGVAAVSMSLAVPIINLGRPRLVANQINEAGSVAGTSLVVVGANALLLALLAAAFGDTLLAQLGVGGAAPILVWPIVAAIVISACSGAFWEGISYLCDRFDIYVRVGMIGAVADMVLVAGAAAAFGLQGAVIALPIGTAVMFGAYAISIGRDPTARELLRNLSAKVSLLPHLLSYSAMMFLTVALTNAGSTFLRSRVLVEAGATANGYLQAVTSLSSYLLAFVMTGFWGHLHARAAAEGDTAVARHELAKSLELGLLISFTGCGAAAVLAPFLIPLFYSHEFLGATDQLIFYIPGEFCFQLLSMFTAYQLTVSLKRNYLAFTLGYITLLVVAGALLIPMTGGTGYVAAHVGASVVMLGAAGLVSWRRGQISGRFLSTIGILVVALSAVCLGLLHVRQFGNSPVNLLPALVPFAISGYLVLKRL